MIYRLSWRGDRWGCRSCSKTYDRWGMIDHICSKNGRNFTEPPSGATGYQTAHMAVDDKFCINTRNEVMTKYMAQIIDLSAEAKAVIRRNIEARKQSSKFLKLEPGEKKVLLFVPEKTDQVISEFNGKKSLRFRYTVIEVEDSGDQDQEKYFEVSKRTSEDIDTFLLEGHTRLKISRSGSGIDTRYLIVPV